ncbi:hypothetical protein [Nocardia iowensis]|uniref:Uncharacterized protein n=1 Tax=Nocardia iowensis TaxID=204891 RepID=A0ABX8RIA0_NOCIO|nr:hypothetical protein [Nocardia iowensis]QXN89347.1 hypothetical protein KV110_27965 [Nocardia iowensis]
MLLLIGGPPRVGKSTLAWMLLERDGIPGCPTDALVSMLGQAAPEHGVRHGMHPDKAESARPFLLAFLEAIADGLDHESDPPDCYAVEGDVVTPAVVGSAAALGLPVAAVFVGNTGMTPELLRTAPHWLDGEDDATYRQVASWIREQSAALRDTCAAAGLPYVDLSTGFDTGLEDAYATLLGQIRAGSHAVGAGDIDE